MQLQHIFAAVLSVATALASQAPSCQNGPVTIRGRQCVRACGYEFTSGSYRNEWKSCYSECAQACAADERCTGAKWSKISKKCYYIDGACSWKYTGRADGIKCDKPKQYITTTKAKTTTTVARLKTTTRCSTTNSAVKMTSKSTSLSTTTKSSSASTSQSTTTKSSTLSTAISKSSVSTTTSTTESTSTPSSPLPIGSPSTSTSNAATTTTMSSQSPTSPTCVSGDVHTQDGTTFTIQCNQVYVLAPGNGLSESNIIRSQNNVESQAACAQLCADEGSGRCVAANYVRVTPLADENAFNFAAKDCILLENTDAGANSFNGVDIFTRTASTGTITTTSVSTTASTTVSTTKSTTASTSSTTSANPGPTCVPENIQATQGTTYTVQCDTEVAFVPSSKRIGDVNFLSVVKNVPNPAACAQTCEQLTGDRACVAATYLYETPVGISGIDARDCLLFDEARGETVPRTGGVALIRVPPPPPTCLPGDIQTTEGTTYTVQCDTECKVTRGTNMAGTLNLLRIERGVSSKEACAQACEQAANDSHACIAATYHFTASGASGANAQDCFLMEETNGGTVARSGAAILARVRPSAKLTNCAADPPVAPVISGFETTCNAFATPSLLSTTDDGVPVASLEKCVERCTAVGTACQSVAFIRESSGTGYPIGKCFLFQMRPGRTFQTAGADFAMRPAPPPACTNGSVQTSAGLFTLTCDTRFDSVLSSNKLVVPDLSDRAACAERCAGNSACLVANYYRKPMLQFIERDCVLLFDNVFRVGSVGADDGVDALLRP